MQSQVLCNPQMAFTRRLAAPFAHCQTHCNSPATIRVSTFVGKRFRAPNSQHRNLSSVKATEEAVYGSEWDVDGDGYTVLGLAHCFEKNDEGKLADKFVIEPIAANGVECMATGAPTCFKHVYGVSVGDAMKKSKAVLPSEFAEGLWCEHYQERLEATARTWLRPHAQDNLMDLVPLGKTVSKYNYNTDLKRVLNFTNVVNDDDNIKQDLSIDVYGRKDKEEEGSEAAPQPEAKEEDEDELDSLLAM